jgi:hypothetical protein
MHMLEKNFSPGKRTLETGWRILGLICLLSLFAVYACSGGSDSTLDTDSPATEENHSQDDDDSSSDDESDNDDMETISLYTWDAADFTHVYDVGPGYAYDEPGDIPWESLEPSTLVRIHYRDTPYRAKWVVNVAATADNPVVVLGVADAGRRPVISGENAVTRSALDYWNEVRSVVKIGGSSLPDNPDGPSYIYIQGLDIRSARPGYYFTDDAGSSEQYSSNAAALHIESGDTITVYDCLLHDAANGLFSSHESANVVISGNHIYDNGIEGSIYEHNSYTESYGIVFEFNHYGPLRSDCLGNNLKDRSCGTVIRYNWIESGNRQLDLVETDSDTFANDPSYDETFVYGNILIEPDGAGNSQILHYGGDSGNTDMYRRGTLYFYHNTVVSTRNGNTTLMRLSTVDVSARVFNNILYSSAGGSYLAITSGNGQTELECNWLPAGWRLTHESGLDAGATVTDLGNTEGTTPGFVDFDDQDFHLANDSQARGEGCDLPVDVDGYSPEYQYVRHQEIEVRVNSTPPDIGAYGWSDDGSI